MSVCATQATWKLSKQQVTSTEKLFLLSCADRAGEEGICWPSLARLAADTCMDIKTVKAVRQSCIRKGLIIYTGEMRGRTKNIPVMKLLYIEQRFDEELNKPNNGLGNKPNNGLVKQAQKRTTESKRKNLKEEPIYIKEKIYKKEKSHAIFETDKEPSEQEPILTPDEAIQDKQDNEQTFALFWSMYPVKKGKKRAEQLWEKQKLHKRFNEIMAALSMQIEKDRQYITGYAPHPATYLNQERWLDEIEEQKQNKPQRMTVEDVWSA